MANHSRLQIHLDFAVKCALVLQLRLLRLIKKIVDFYKTEGLAMVLD